MSSEHRQQDLIFAMWSHPHPEWVRKCSTVVMKNTTEIRITAMGKQSIKYIYSFLNMIN